ncbi:hypothetical protein [Streptomyces anulatus]|uniref:hypothetical protein n=1 Tax=Streptomyces anulatus TaxID=1892 RepID=UPI0033DCFE73
MVRSRGEVVRAELRECQGAQHRRDISGPGTAPTKKRSIIAQPEAPASGAVARATAPASGLFSAATSSRSSRATVV